MELKSYSVYQAGLYSLVLCLRVSLGTNPKWEHLKGAQFGQVPVLIVKSTLGRKILPKNKHPSLLGPLEHYKKNVNVAQDFDTQTNWSSLYWMAPRHSALRHST